MQKVHSPFLFNHLLIFSTVALILGIWIAHYQFSFKTTLIIAGLLSIITGIYSSYPFNKILSTIIVIAVYMIAMVRYKQQTDYFDQFYASIGNTITCQATVESIEPIEHKKFNYLLVINTNLIKTNEAKWKKDFYTIHIYTCNKPYNMVGDLVELSDLKIKKPSNTEFAHYLIKEKVVATSFIPFCRLTLVHRPIIDIKRMLAKLKMTLVSSLKRKCSKTTYALFSTIFLGKKSKTITSTLKQNCKVWGISHYLARSGLHLILFIALWSLILNSVGLPYYCKSVCIILLTFFYYLLSWPSVSFHRAFFTFILHHLCTIFSLPSQLFYLLTLVCFATLLINPYQLFALDFQLSFSLAFVISWQKHQLSIKSRSKPKLLNY